MTTRIHRYVLAAAVTLAGLGTGLTALAHSTGHESRTPAQCNLLPGTATTGERGHCLACVARGNTHWHPDYPQGNRCRPDNGQP
jgi:hypothetical protein